MRTDEDLRRAMRELEASVAVLAESVDRRENSLGALRNRTEQYFGQTTHWGGAMSGYLSEAKARTDQVIRRLHDAELGLGEEAVDQRVAGFDFDTMEFDIGGRVIIALPTGAPGARLPRASTDLPPDSFELIQPMQIVDEDREYECRLQVPVRPIVVGDRRLRFSLAGAPRLLLGDGDESFFGLVPIEDRFETRTRFFHEIASAIGEHSLPLSNELSGKLDFPWNPKRTAVDDRVRVISMSDISPYRTGVELMGPIPVPFDSALRVHREYVRAMMERELQKYRSRFSVPISIGVSRTDFRSGEIHAKIIGAHSEDYGCLGFDATISVRVEFDSVFVVVQGRSRRHSLLNEVKRSGMIHTSASKFPPWENPDKYREQAEREALKAVAGINWISVDLMTHRIDASRVKVSIEPYGLTAYMQNLKAGS